MIIKLPNGYLCDIDQDFGALYIIHILHEIFYLDVYESLSIKPTDIVLDCGAHIGLFALKVADLCSCVVAVEPTSTNFSLLERNIMLNGLKRKIIPIKRILYSKSGLLRHLFLSKKEENILFTNL